MTPKKAIMLGLQKTLVFGGRASRKEFFYLHLFALYVTAFDVALYCIKDMILDSALPYIFLLLFGLMSIVATACIAVGVRRLHDTDTSGVFYLWALTGIGAPFVARLWITRGDATANTYGPPVPCHQHQYFWEKSQWRTFCASVLLSIAFFIRVTQPLLFVPWYIEEFWQEEDMSEGVSIDTNEEDLLEDVWEV